ncbi:MAG: hypothetical protein FD123_733 [Bacteroidetes bacterium]|nr:MAG: hypothetical protein FD123_733 [Bacteroidota bacterium]
MKKSMTLVLLPCLMLLAACSGDSGKPAGDSAKPKDSTDLTTDDMDDDSDDAVSYTLPSPLQVAALFKKSGLKYLPGVGHDAASSSKYSTRFQRAQNMGVYSADMAYCVMNKQNNEAVKYMKVVKECATAVDLGKIFENNGLYERFNKNLDNEDSLRGVIADIQMETDMLMAQNDQKQLYGIIYSGAWVESMYIGAQVYKKSPDEKIVPKLLEQMTILSSIIKELKVNESKDAGIPTLLADFSALQTIYENIPAIKTIKESDDVDFNAVKVSKEDLDQLIQKIEQLRSKIVNG